MTTEFDYMPIDEQKQLIKIANQLLEPEKGLLCMDEINSVMVARFRGIGMRNNAENRRIYRQLMISANWERNLQDNISGIVMSYEGFRQQCDSGILFRDYLKKRHILVGVKFDMDINYLTGSRGEYTTQGLDNLRNRCAAYKKEGASFAKWRIVFKIMLHEPSFQCIDTNAKLLARFASTCQSVGLVPIIQPEVLMDGDHTMERCEMVMEALLGGVVKALSDHHVLLEGLLLSTNMVTPGVDCEEFPENNYTIAQATLRVLNRTIPPAIPGILFISGGQQMRDVLLNLNTINRKKENSPWVLTFLFGRVFVRSTLQLWWGGGDDSIIKAHIDLLNRTWASGRASVGRYVESMFKLYGSRVRNFSCNYNM